MPAREVGEYFAEGFWRSDYAAGVRGRVGAYHRTLSTYVNSVARAGFAVRRLGEPRAEGDIATRQPGYHRIPAVLVVRCGKQGLGGQDPDIEHE
ncbi:MAG: hypothetical protein HYY04_06720 [Chloroflexi bacterium]|nr:hypothetical protein [Chloroflexota bacterium]